MNQGKNVFVMHPIMQSQLRSRGEKRHHQDFDSQFLEESLKSETAMAFGGVSETSF